MKLVGYDVSWIWIGKHINTNKTVRLTKNVGHYQRKTNIINILLIFFANDMTVVLCIKTLCYRVVINQTADHQSIYEIHMWFSYDNLSIRRMVRFLQLQRRYIYIDTYALIHITKMKLHKHQKQAADIAGRRCKPLILTMIIITAICLIYTVLNHHFGRRHGIQGCRFFARSLEKEWTRTGQRHKMPNVPASFVQPTAQVLGGCQA